jgi:hypothetical protein
MKTDSGKENAKPESNGDALKADGRRGAIKKIAIYSAYAPPALFALMHSTKAQAFSLAP